MAGKTQTAAIMVRPKSEKPKDAVISLRTFPEVRDAVEGYARKEHRTLAQMADLLLREAVIARRKLDRQSVTDIESLP